MHFALLLAALVLVLALLILGHEFGHFIVAKAFGIRVDEFAIGFPPRLLSVQWGETRYSLNLLFFGGYVKIFGESAEDGEVLKDPRSFVHKPRLVQAAVIVAGICFNILFAWLALSAGYMVGMPTSADHEGVGQVEHAQTTIVSVLPDSPAANAGLLPEDVVLSAQTGTATLPPGATAAQLQDFIGAHQDESVVLAVSRVSTTTHLQEEKTFLARPVEGLAEGHKAIGIGLDDVGVLKLSPPMALVQGAYLTKQMTVATAEGLVGFFSKIFQGQAKWKEVSGPIGITVYGAGAVASGFIPTVLLAAIISINLALINVLPLPGLDGGRLLFVVIEAIRRKPLSEKLSFRITLVSMSLLVLLMLIISYHDVLRLVHPV